MTDRVDAVLRALALKDESRTGWDLRGVTDPESVAAHSWSVAYLTLLYADAAGVNADRALRMAVLHDLGEAIVGDVATRADPGADTPDADVMEEREHAAVAELLAPFDEDHEALWAAYEARESPEARFVKDMDLVDMCLQAVVYERGDRYAGDDGANFDAYDDLDEFFATAEPRISTVVGRELFEAARERYERAKKQGKAGE